ncbi:phosphotransferase system lactose/cellobiose-specific IIB subunit [Coriobacterium glomerans PW2]|uniref:Phosphotransferase system lactose/cellobiose-specific IIB subunit n=1 Tax=Coriobacterium glomerans (strain ATCC 49209 / DSM 20642 / JCM 10262 / PW2) TaxID=700015 RepID=F2N9X7_CORGP|nr:PTS sugar transporter subunit IIB [Coriobacterium glomerans]AEB06232.1 phosphotransferase system lactose/cellobiose-specific IIB subunit [Coriobacterium glomerans PW2]
MVSIVLMCSQGASTSILVQKMKKSAEDQQIKCKIAAYSVNALTQIKDAADIILLGPQVKYMLAKIQAEVHCKVIPIDMRMYGLMDGESVLQTAIQALGSRGLS